MKYKLNDLQLAGSKQVDNAKALLKLLNEKYNREVLMTFSRARSGRAHPDKKRFTIPLHALNKDGAYLEYYVIHEFTHCLGFWRHDTAFKRKEKQLLKLFGIDIKYAKAYPKELSMNGQRFYQK